MRSLFARFWDWLLTLLLNRIVLVLALMLCIAAGIALSNMSRLSSSLIQSQAVQNAALYTQSLTQVIDLYSNAAVDRAKTVSGITVTHDYPIHDGAIPLPSTFAIEIGERISEHNTDVSVRLYSDYPFPWRKAKGGTRDAFERQAIDFLNQNPNQKFFRFVQQDGHTLLRYGESSIMQPSCVACHNTHPDSPKKDWEVGDVGGVWEISQPLDNLVAKIGTNLKGTFVMLGGISILGLSGLTLVIGKLRQIARELEQRIRERTADLADANTDLEKRNRLIRHVFGRYLSDNVVNNLLDSPEGLKLGGERRKVTILTSDLRGFTALSERLQPEQVIDILNLYLEQMADVINHYQGTIDEFMGDGILVLFGAPIAREDDAVRAIACACAMQLVMGAVNEKMKALGLSQLEMGIGINTGEVVVGNIGSEKRAKYGIVGSQVNLAYRIESYTKGGQILVAEETLKQAGTGVRINEQKQVQPKGFKQPIAIYSVYGVSGLYNVYLPQDEEVFFPIPDAIPLQYSILEGKNISQTAFAGSLVKLSSKGAEIRSKNPSQNRLLSELTDLKINLSTSSVSVGMSEDIYAKVLEKPTRESFYVRFTAIPPVIQTQLDALYQASVTVKNISSQNLNSP